MSRLGAAFEGGVWRRLYAPLQVPGLWQSVAIAVALVILNQILQAVFGLLSFKLMFGGAVGLHGDLIKGYMVGLFPAALATVAVAWAFARLKGARPTEILSLRSPGFTPLGWLVLILGFVICLYAAIFLGASLLGIDLEQFAPTEGQDNADTIGVVKQAMFDIAHDPRLFLLVLPSVVIGAPLAEEIIFRGQLFNALAHSRAGISGATLLTAGAWAGLHLTEPLFSVGIIFVMGLVFGYLMYRFNSLWVTIMCHGVWNAIYAVIMFNSVGAS